ncbi:MAG: molybdopterin molybdenumtransferase MoeA, partial [Lachnospiraceae bacterium]|nr:molybdopterin molybdenumtransferase MoeA [Lachnospiraceae bacterium]
MMNVDHREAIRLLTDRADRIGTQKLDIQNAFGRILGEDVTAGENVPPFDRSPYDGYAFMASDTDGVF